MKSILKEKLEKLNSKYDEDLDVISLKALCAVEESKQTQNAIKIIIERLRKKYPNDKEIKDLELKKEKISLEELIEVIEERYLDNVEITTIKALYNLPSSKEKENAIEKCLERILELNPNDKEILGYLEKIPENFLMEGVNNICLAYEKQRELEGNPIPENEKFNAEEFAKSGFGQGLARFSKLLAKNIEERQRREKEEKKWNK